MVMRSFPWIIGIPLVLLAGCAARYSEPEAVQTSLTSPTWAVKGYGETVEDARQRALEKARDSVEDYLEKRYPSIGWQPTVGNLLAQSVVKVDEPKPSELDQLKGYETTAHVDLRSANLVKLQAEVDQAREQAQANVLYWRHLLVGRILAALVALFLIVGGYLRLEEMTRGYYTTLLRVVAGAALLLIVAVVVIV
jgi:hypothetical protein